MLQLVKLVCALILAAAVTAVVAGAADAAPSRAEFIRKGDALCAQVLRELVPIRRRAEAAKALPEAQRWTAVTSIWTDQIAIQKRFNTRFRGLGVPKGDRTAAQLVGSFDRGVVLARRVRDGFATRDTAALSTALPGYIRFTLTLNRRVVAYGFRVCGR